MGSWNETCVLTHLPIMYGEDVYLLVLAENHCKSRGGAIAPETFYAPHGFLFSGKYNDYGSIYITPEAEEDAKLNIEFLKNSIVDFEQGPNEYHDHPVNAKDLNLEMLMMASREERLMFKNIYKNNEFGINGDRLGAVVMMKKDVVDSLLKKYNPRCYTNLKRTDKDGRPKYGYRTLDQIFDQQFSDYFLKRTGAGIGDDMFAGMYTLPDVMRCEVIGVSTDDIGMKELLRDSVHDVDLFFTLREKIRQLVKLRGYMHDSRRTWIPASGAGSQDSETDMQRLMMSLTNKEIKKIKKEFDEF